MNRATTSETSRTIVRRRRRHHHWLPLLLTLAFAWVAAGCGSQGRPTLKLVSLGEERSVYTQRFSDAYASRSEDGEYDLVLVNDVEVPSTLASSGGGGGGGAAVPAAASGVPTSLRQLMHVRVLWKPRRGMRGNLPGMSNASIRWYVVGHSGRGTEVLEYAGTGMVSVNQSGKTAKFDIRTAELKPVEPKAGAAAATLADPVGRARLGGTVTARLNRQRVSDLLAEVKGSVYEGSPQAAGY